MLITCCAYRYVQYVVFVCFHNVSNCDLTHLVYSMWMPVWKSCYWDLRYMWMVWKMCMVYWHIHVCVHSQMILCHSVPEIMAVHMLCVLTGWENWEQWDEICKGCTAVVVQHKTDGYPGVNIQDFTGVTSESLVFTSICTLVWIWCTGLFVCAGSWHNGLVFNALIHAHCPDLIDFNALQLCCHIDKLNNAFDAANSELGIPWLLDAEIW